MKGSAGSPDPVSPNRKTTERARYYPPYFVTRVSGHRIENAPLIEYQTFHGHAFDSIHQMARPNFA